MGLTSITLFSENIFQLMSVIVLKPKTVGYRSSPVINPLIDSPLIFHPPVFVTTLAIVLSWQPLAARDLCCEEADGCIVIYHASILFDSSEIGIISSSKLQLLFIKLES